MRNDAETEFSVSTFFRIPLFLFEAPANTHHRVMELFTVPLRSPLHSHETLKPLRAASQLDGLRHVIRPPESRD